MMIRLLPLAIAMVSASCQASSYIRPPYTLGQEKCEKVLLPAGMWIGVCELSVGFERTCYVVQREAGAYMATPCKFYDEVVRAPKIVR